MNSLGYLYFHKAPTAKDFHEETVRKLDKLHQYDCLLRANKSLAAWGIEGRVPFDKEFMDAAMRINPQDKMINAERMEWVVRKPSKIIYLKVKLASKRTIDGVGYQLDRHPQRSQRLCCKRRTNGQRTLPFSSTNTTEQRRVLLSLYF